MTGDKAGTLGSALQLVLEIVETEAVGGTPPGVARLAAQLGLHESQVSRILKDLQALEIVERDEPTRGFLAGPRFFRLAAAGLDPGLVARARPALRALAARFGAPALLAVRRDDLALTVEVELPRGLLRLASSTWWRSCWCTGAGRALLLDHLPEELRALFRGEAFDEGGPQAGPLTWATSPSGWRPMPHAGSSSPTPSSSTPSSRSPRRSATRPA